MESCPPGYFAHGMRIKYERDSGSLDETGLNAIELACKNRAVPSSGDTYIKGAEGVFGGWQAYQYCPQGEYVIGFALQSESWRGGNKDDVAANNFAAYCGRPEAPRRRYSWIQGSVNERGSWTRDQFCPARQIVCGIIVQIEPAQAPHVDDASLDSVGLKCCDF